MAWQQPLHVCGHYGERYQAYGPGKTREYELRRRESRKCPDCAAEEAKAQTPQAWAEINTGTPKQIAWALQLRAERIPQIEIAIGQIATSQQPELIRDEAIAIYKRMQSKQTAQYWIDRRETLRTADSAARWLIANASKNIEDRAARELAAAL